MDLLRFHVVAGAAGLDPGRAVLELQLGAHAGDLDDRHRASFAAAPARALSTNGRPLIVLAAILRRLDPHPLLGAADLVLFEQEADLLLVLERGEDEEGEDDADQRRQRDLQDADQPVVRRRRAAPSRA